jgi:hypothetical protein
MRSEVLLVILALLVSTVAAAKDEDRTLEAIQIEGEIAVPQVLFITSRDHPRFRDGLRERYHRTALDIAGEATWPRRLNLPVVHPEPVK